MKIPKVLGFRLASKFAAVTVTIVFFTQLIIFSISYVKYKETINHVVDSRFLVIANDLEQTISNGLDLGLSLRELQTTQAVIDNVKKSDPLILSISVFSLEASHRGRILYNTRYAGVERNIPTRWVIEADEKKLEKYWAITDNDVGVIGVALLNNFKEPIGGIIVRYDQSQVNKKTSYFAEEMLKSIFLVSAIGLVAIFLLIRYILAPLCFSFQRMTETIDVFIDHGKFHKFEGASSFEISFLEMLQSTQKTWQDINKVESHLQKDMFYNADIA